MDLEGTTGFATTHRGFGNSCSDRMGLGTTAHARPAIPTTGEDKDERWLSAFRWVENIPALDAGKLLAHNILWAKSLAARLFDLHKFD